jgi:hypothetical protein
MEPPVLPASLLCGQAPEPLPLAEKFAGGVRSGRANSVPVESEFALHLLRGRIFYGKPVPTSPENALIAG